MWIEHVLCHLCKEKDWEGEKDREYEIKWLYMGVSKGNERIAKNGIGFKKYFIIIRAKARMCVT